MKSLMFVVSLALGVSSSLSAAGPETLREAAKGLFHVGVAVSSRQVAGAPSRETDAVVRNFDSITPENALKWEKIHPEAGRYDFADADAYVAFGQKHGLWTIGHTLLWHQQTPSWVFKNQQGGDVSKEELLKRLREHIHTVVGRYNGKIGGWDVANESYDTDGKLRVDFPWYRILGEEAIFAAFEAAHEADPSAELYYNEFSLWEPGKRASVLKLVGALRSRGLRVDAIGLQEHLMLATPSIAEMESVISDFHDIGIQVMVTELDVTVLDRPDGYLGADISMNFQQRAEFDPYRNGLPALQEQALAARYGAIFALYRRRAADIRRVTVWGLTDAGSWLNHWPIRGRVDYPLLFDRSCKPKLAYKAALDALSPSSSSAR